MKREKVKVVKRTIFGKKVKSLRKKGILPANVYGKDIKSQAVELPSKEFSEVFKKAHQTSLVDVELDGQTIPALIHNVKIHPRTRELLHAEFFKVDLKEKIKSDIPIVAVGESPAVANKLGLLLQTLSQVEIQALPTDLPEKIEVNIEQLTDVNQEIKVSDLKVGKEVEILSDPSQIVFKVGALVTKETEQEVKAEEAAAAAAAEATTEAGAAQETAPTEKTPEQPKPEENKPKE